MKVTITLTGKNTDVFDTELPIEWFEEAYFPAELYNFLAQKFKNNEWEDLVCNSVHHFDTHIEVSVSCL